MIWWNLLLLLTRLVLVIGLLVVENLLDLQAIRSLVKLNHLWDSYPRAGRLAF